jgi:hypothetical protein
MKKSKVKSKELKKILGIKLNPIEKAFLKAIEQEEQKRINLKKKYPNWTFVKAKKHNKTK